MSDIELNLCPFCDAETMVCTTMEKAIKKWNTRALGWIPVEFFGLPENNEHNSRFWITIEYDNGNRRVVEATWDYFCKCFAYKNNKKVLQDVVVYMQYCEPKPYSPEPLETRKDKENE